MQNFAFQDTSKKAFEMRILRGKNASVVATNLIHAEQVIIFCIIFSSASITLIEFVTDCCL